MPAAVPFRPRAAGWRSLLLLALASASLPAAAQSMACGTYKDVDGNTTLTIESEGHGFLSGPYQATEQLRIARQEDVLGTGNLSTGRLENWYFSDNDRTISTPYREFTREHTATCRTMPEPIEGGCVMNTSECLEALPEAEPLKLHAWCAEGVGAACMQLLETYQRQAKDAAPAPARSEPPMPEICKEDSASFNAEGCRAIAEVVGAEMMGKAVLGLQHSNDPVLPSAQLDELAALCRQQHGEAFCADVAEALWSGGRLLQAHDALQLSCAKRADGVACGRAEALARLASVPAAALAPVPASALPCGSYEAEYGVLSQLRFLDGGLVEAGGRDQRLRASLQDGRILIHRDVGSDFVLQPLKNGNLASVDGGNRFAYYERKPGSGNASCAPPVAFVEIPCRWTARPWTARTAPRPAAPMASCWAARLPARHCSKTNNGPHRGPTSRRCAARVCAKVAWQWPRCMRIPRIRRFRRPWRRSARRTARAPTSPAMWTRRATGRR